jgi:nicotinamidase-related amidase
MKIKKENTCLLVIDLQEKLIPAMSDYSDELIENCIKLIKGCQILGVPIIVSEQYPKGLGSTISQVDELLNGVKPISKTEFSCIENSEIKSKLQALGRRYVIVCGVEAHVCVQQSVLDLMDEDFKPILIIDCIASRKKIDKKIAINRMKDYGSDFTTLESILFEMLVSSVAVEFKDISKLVR